MTGEANSIAGRQIRYTRRAAIVARSIGVPIGATHALSEFLCGDFVYLQGISVPFRVIRRIHYVGPTPELTGFHFLLDLSEQDPHLDPQAVLSD